MISEKDWKDRIDAFIAQENERAGTVMPVYRIYCQDGTDRSGGGIYNETVTVDTIGRFARALGDSNPLYSDPAYAASGIFGGIVAPPLVECCICSTFISGRMPRLRGISVYDAGTRWDRFLPIRPGDSFSAETTFLGVEELTKHPSGAASREAGEPSRDRLLLRKNEIDLINQRGEHVSRLTAREIIRCAAPDWGKMPRNMEQEANRREAARSAALRGEDLCADQIKKTRPHYSEDRLEAVYANLDAQLRGDFRRGSIPRCWEDVEIGEELQEQIVGPYDESDGNALMAAIGVSNAFATKWGKIRKGKGKGLIDPETGARRHPIDRHSSDPVARAQGLPGALVYGIHSQALLAKLVGDWMGDEGFLCSLDCRCRRPLYYGDLSIQRGRVTRKYEKDGNHFAVIRVEGVRQDGTVHTEAEAVVRLPVRKASEKDG